MTAIDVDCAARDAHQDGVPPWDGEPGAPGAGWWSLDDQAFGLLWEDTTDGVSATEGTEGGDHCWPVGAAGSPAPPSSIGTGLPHTRHGMDGGPTSTSGWDRMLEWAEALPPMPGHMFDHSLLDPDQERFLAVRIQAGLRAAKLRGSDVTRASLRDLRDGQRACAILVRANLRLARMVAVRTPSSLTQEDLVSFGVLGLMRAALKFDPDRGRFSTYATWWIRQVAHRGADDTERLIRLPVHAADQLRASRRVELEMAAGLGRGPTLGEVAAECGLPAEKLAWLRLIAQTPLSLDDFVDRDADERTSDWWTLLSADDLGGADAFEAAEERMVCDGVHAALDRFEWDVRVGEVDRPRSGSIVRDMRMLRLRMGMVDGEEWTLDRIGHEYGVTRERVRQVVNGLLANPELRRRLADAAGIALPDRADEGGAGVRNGS